MKTTNLLQNLNDDEFSITAAPVKQHHTFFIGLAFTTLIVSSQLAAAVPVAWSCGAWTKSPTNSCVETQKCTRTVCDTKGSISNCRNETKTNTSTDLDCTPAPTKPKSRTLGENSMSLEQKLKIKKSSPAGPIPVPYPITSKVYKKAHLGTPIKLARTERLRLTNGKSILQPSVGITNIFGMNGVIVTSYTKASLFKDTQKNIWVNANGTKTKLGVFSRIERQKLQKQKSHSNKMKLPK